MTPAQQGHRDAAQGTESSSTDVEYSRAFDRVEGFRQRGLDPNGHPPVNPHLCRRNPRTVCNCCTSCEVLCFAEPIRDKARRLFDVPLRTLDRLRKVLR